MKASKKLVFSILVISLATLKVWEISTSIAKSVDFKRIRVLKQKLPLFVEISKPLKKSDVPFFWHIPKSGGSTVKNILDQCYGLKQAKKIQGQPKETLEVFGNYVNLDTATPEGIKLAAYVGLVPSKLADVIVSGRIYNAQNLFNINQRPRMFTLLRHPFHRIYSNYRYLKKAKWESAFQHFSKHFSNSTFLDYIHRMNGNNMMTSALTDVPNADITDETVEQATQILAQKCLVGLMDEFNVSIYRFQTYFGWKISENKKGCISRLVYEKPINSNRQNETDTLPKTLSENSREWGLLSVTNKYDLKLYNNAKKIFFTQGNTIDVLRQMQ